MAGRDAAGLCPLRRFVAVCNPIPEPSASINARDFLCEEPALEAIARMKIYGELLAGSKQRQHRLRSARFGLQAAEEDGRTEEVEIPNSIIMHGRTISFTADEQDALLLENSKFA
ncbi:unnamed protein product [Cylicocyclus nassatus]|uniref:Uncharacterized protein n=1 Tax=Cylicocyclus nassatus TaxID=53992 RepID=A0AA36HH73_CYLNA|nr:unnamed protein product [Cylicocyclus nassatus]